MTTSLRAPARRGRAWPSPPSGHSTDCKAWEQNHGYGRQLDRFAGRRPATRIPGRERRADSAVG